MIGADAVVAQPGISVSEFLLNSTDSAAGQIPLKPSTLRNVTATISSTNYTVRFSRPIFGTGQRRVSGLHCIAYIICMHVDVTVNYAFKMIMRLLLVYLSRFTKK
jgi:hypothetical protein